MAPKKKNAKKTKSTKQAKAAPKQEPKTNLDTAYLLDRSDRPVTFEMILGAPGQSGTTDIRLDNVHLVNERQGSIPEFAIGTNKKLDGKTVYITTVVTDTAKDTNYCTTILRLRGGIRFEEHPLSKVASQEGDSVIFTSVIELVCVQ